MRRDGAAVKNTPLNCILWIDWLNKIISFHKADDCEKKFFSSQDAMLDYAIEKGTSGFRIQ